MRNEPPDLQQQLLYGHIYVGLFIHGATTIRARDGERRTSLVYYFLCPRPGRVIHGMLV